MTEQPQPRPEPPTDPVDGPHADASADGSPEAIPAHTDDQRDVEAEPADAHRPNPESAAAEQAPDPDDADESSREDDVAVSGEEDAVEASKDDPGASSEDDADDEAALAASYEELAAKDPRTPGELLAALHATEARRDDYLDALQRKQAEFENFRKRMQANGQAQRVAGHADVAGRMLDVLDDFDRTLGSIADDVDDGVLKGITLVRDKLMGALREVGLERVDDQGAPFDPNRHEAVQQVPGEAGSGGDGGDGGEPIVAEVLRPGYVLGPKVLRAAMVAVTQ